MEVSSSGDYIPDEVYTEGDLELVDCQQLFVHRHREDFVKKIIYVICGKFSVLVVHYT